MQAGDKTGDLDYTGADALSLNGSTIRDAAGNDATLTLPMPGGPGSLANSSDIVIDAAAKAQPQTAMLKATIVAADQPQPRPRDRRRPSCSPAASSLAEAEAAEAEGAAAGRAPRAGRRRGRRPVRGGLGL